MKGKLHKHKSRIAKVLTFAIVVMAVGLQTTMAFAASTTSMSDNLSREKISTLSNHEIFFVTPTGLTAGQTITLSFQSGFTMGSVAFGDVDFATGSTSTCTSATYTEQTLAASPSGATWGVGISGQVLTLTSGTGTVTANRCVRFRIGTNAVTGGAGTNRITNPSSAASYTVTIGGTFGDAGVIAVPIITDDQVQVTATVDPSITFSISANSIGFGTLSASGARYATTGGGNGSPTVAHTLAVGTNATSGYTMYLTGDTLTSGANTITAPAGPSASTVGSEQFGINLSASGGSGTVDTQYGTSSQYGFGSTATVQDNLASATGASATTTYSATYIANIAAQTEAGSYATTLTYTATATF